MNTMKWLLRREFWEHKGAMLWAPLVAAALIIAVMGGSLMYGAATGKFDSKTTVRFDSGKEVTVTEAFAGLAANKKEQIADAVSGGFIAPAGPLFIMMAFTIFFYCLNSMNEERRDRSILFWKSLPVSDGETVLSKALVALFVIPLITVVVAVCMSLILLFFAGIVAAMLGVNMWGAVLGNGDFYLTPLRLIGLLPVYMVWALPTVGWLMLVSAWAKSKVFLWAVVAPLIAMLIVKWTAFVLGVGLNLDWFARHVLLRGLAGIIPGTWIPMSGMEHNNSLPPADAISAVFTGSWATLATAPAILGAVAGIAMIYGASRLRRWKDEG
ncbi:hypothetical protein KY495_23005 [Massilia sp. PAMC28688]|uniref:hypothetical protein n=1 Tax=Massilia sp. PAMC28688 TaxID=2861283 RepID=UPI001C636F77|nr:hypothetical protein [Massilia sp. PAMC28688]QYF93493.1 hypothetical protein KY495_23005 [Massilia sp. PAMC28688]